MSLHFIPDISPWTKEKLIQQKQIQRIHTDLPDDVDEFGNLPQLRCGWTKCGRTFNSKEALLAHVKQCISHPFVPRFHLNCKNVLENDPDLTFEQFSQKVKDCYCQKDIENIEKSELLSYYNKFQTVFKQHQFIKDTTKMSSAQKEIAEILFNFRIESQKTLIEQNNIPIEFLK